MLLLKNRGFKRQYVYGGSGLFDSIASFIARLFTSSAAKQIASTAVDVGKNAAKEVGKKAFDVGKNAVVDAGKKMIQKGVTKILTPKSQTILHKHVGVPMQQSSPDAVAKQAQSILSKYIDTDINTLIDGSGIRQQKAIAIQDLVRKIKWVRSKNGMIFIKKIGALKKSILYENGFYTTISLGIRNVFYQVSITSHSSSRDARSLLTTIQV